MIQQIILLLEIYSQRAAFMNIKEEDKGSITIALGILHAHHTLKRSIINVLLLSKNHQIFFSVNSKQMSARVGNITSIKHSYVCFKMHWIGVTK